MTSEAGSDVAITADLKPGVVIASTLDVKAEEIGFVRALFAARGLNVILIDCGVLGAPGLHADIPSELVARAAGHDLAALRAQASREVAIPVMHRGLGIWISHLQRAGMLLGYFGIGGATNSALAATAFRLIPYGVPKLLVSTKASGDLRAEIGIKDVVVMNSVVDVLGLNSFLRDLIRSAVAMMAAMIGERADPDASERKPASPHIALTAFGCTTGAATHALSLFNARNFEVLAFHARGTGGLAAESFIREGRVQAMFDLTTTEIADEIVGGVQSAGPDRLGAAGERGIPQVVLPGAIDVVNFGPRDTVPERFRDRKLAIHNPGTTLMRTTAEENRQIADFVAERLNASTGPTGVVIPQRGFSSYDVVGSPFFDPDADAAFVSTLVARLRPHVRVIHMDTHLNDLPTMQTAAGLLMDMMDGANSSEKNNALEISSGSHR